MIINKFSIKLISFITKYRYKVWKFGKTLCMSVCSLGMKQTQFSRILIIDFWKKKITVNTFENYKILNLHCLNKKIDGIDQYGEPIAFQDRISIIQRHLLERLDAILRHIAVLKILHLLAQSHHTIIVHQNGRRIRKDVQYVR